MLGVMMLGKDAIAHLIERLRGTDFYWRAHEIGFDAVTDLYARGAPADALAKRGEMARVGGASYVHTWALWCRSLPSAGTASSMCC